MQSYFQQQEGENFNLLFDSAEQAQNYIDTYKAAVTYDGSEVLSESITMAPQPQSSVVIMDQHTGYVKAIVGGRGEKTSSLSLNRATSTLRQPGSTFKLVSTYAPALNECGMTLATTYTDKPITYKDGTPVKNATNSYRGETTIREAIIHSINTVAVPMPLHNLDMSI